MTASPINSCYHCTAGMLHFPYSHVHTPGVKANNLTVDVDTVLHLVTAIVDAKGHPVPFYEPLTTQTLQA